MRDYRQNVQQSGIQPHIDLADDGWLVLDGEPVQSMRFDYGSMAEGPVVAIWQCTPGTIHKEQHPFNEFVTLFEGRVDATLNGETQTLEAGDSLFVAKGDSITWAIKETVKKYLVACGNGPLIS